MFRQRTGSSLCYRCGKLNRVDAAECFYCGARRPGLWGFAPSPAAWWGASTSRERSRWHAWRSTSCRSCWTPPPPFRARNPFDMLSPSDRALVRLGMAGAAPWAAGWWWTLHHRRAHLHGSLLHIVFNLLWVRQVAPAVAQLFGSARLVVIYTVAGVLGFVLSNLIGIRFTLGASGAVFGLLGAMVAYGRSRGGAFGVAVLRQYGQWALFIFIASFFLAGVNNWGHAGGFVGGYLAASVLGHLERRPERGVDRLAALGAVAFTVLSFALAIWNGFLR